MTYRLWFSKQLVSWETSSNQIVMDKEFEDNVSCMTIISKDKNEFALIGLDSGRFLSLNLISGKNLCFKVLQNYKKL